jgi:NAD(P)-dependent dehydrogenase (short-subunit alcohol dehydrogenase family)
VIATDAAVGGFDFTGQRVLVTGASHGIGFAVARAFATAGAEIALLSSTADIHDAAARIEAESGRRVQALVCDISQQQAVRRAVGGLDRLDVLVNNAGLELMTPVLKPAEEVDQAFVRIIQINVVGAWYVTRAALPLMDRGGRIILTSSVWGRTGAAGFSAYVASKHANIGLMRTLAKELGPKGIRVNAVCPGWVRTRAALRSLKEVSVLAGASEDAMLGDILSAQALPGLMEPEDVAGLYLSLASEYAASVTGQAYNVDRGEVMA